mmetsp:Transcript_11968/g.34144  ORF Transcript_11968/g.34144 Transcript_11968/m.34144 type:complete len:931 (+) Transcript_11968:84-2876(+)
MAGLALFAAAAVVATVAADDAVGRECAARGDCTITGEADLESLLQARQVLAKRHRGSQSDSCGDPAWVYPVSECDAGEDDGGWGSRRRKEYDPPPAPCKSQSQYPWCDMYKSPEERAKLLVAELNWTELAEQVSCDIFAGVPAISRLGVNAYNYIRENNHGLLWNDVCPTTTMYPQAISIAASFDRDLWLKISNQAAVETRYNYDLGKQNSLFTQTNFNIFLDPRWGRGQEVPGEDPYLNTEYAATWIAGVQAPGGPNAVPMAGTSCKHFAAYSLEGAGGWPYPAENSNRHNFNAEVSEQDLADTHFPMFERCSKEGAMGMMTAYNAVNGIPSAANGKFNNDKARGEWGFTGASVTDCGAVEDTWLRHKYVATGKEAAEAVLEGGTDIECGGTVKKEATANMAPLLRQAVERSFTQRFRLGEFDVREEDRKTEMYDRALHSQTAYEAAVQGTVLLKNDDNLLPLSRYKRLAVMGPLKRATWQALGNYAAYKDGANWTDSPNVVSPLQGLQACGLGDGLQVIEGGPTICSATAETVPGWKTYPEKPDVDAVLVVAGLYCQDEQMQDPDRRPYVSGKCEAGCLESEGCDRPHLELPRGQREMLQRVQRWGLPVVLAVMAGGALDLSAYEESDTIKSILWMGYPGQAAGTALARMLFGYDAPSGKLTQTLYRSRYADQVPMQRMGMRPDAKTDYPGRTYRFVSSKQLVLYPFGFGLTFNSWKFQWSRVPGTSSTTTSTRAPPPLEGCGWEPAATCTENTQEICYYDSGCSETPPTKGGLGCNAGGKGQNCRFCGFGQFPACPGVALAQEAASSAEEEAGEEADRRFTSCRLHVEVSLNSKAVQDATPTTSVLLFLWPPSGAVEGAPIKKLSGFDRVRGDSGVVTFTLSRKDFELADPEGKFSLQTGSWMATINEPRELTRFMSVESYSCQVRD